MKEYNLEKFLLTIKERKNLIIAVLIISIAISLIVTFLTEPEYESKATILVESDKLKNELFYSTPFSFVKQKNLLYNYSEILKSHALMELVLKELQNTKAKNYFKSVEDIQKNISIRIVKETDILHIKARSKKKEFSEILCETYAKTFENFVAKITKEDVRKIKEFTFKSLKDIEKELQAKEDELTNFKKENRITHLEEGTKELFQNIINIKKLYNEAYALYSEKKEELENLKKSFNENKKQLNYEVTKESPSLLSEMQKTYQNLEIEKTYLLLSGYPLTHEKIKKIEEKQKEIRENLLKTNTVTFLDPIDFLKNLERMIIFKEIEILALQAKLNKLSQLLSQYEKELSLLPEKEKTYLKLMRDLEVLQKIYSLLREKNEEAKINEAGRISGITLIESSTPAKKIKPSLSFNLISAILFGLLFSFSATFLVDYLNNTIKSVSDIEKMNLSVLTTIPNLNNKINNKNGIKRYVIPFSDEKTACAESYRLLKTSLSWLFLTENKKTLLITSPSPKEGKSTIAANLSYIFAQSGLKTLLIDLDLRKPTIHSIFSLERKPGFTDLILNNLNGNVLKKPFENLYILPAGSLTPSPADLLEKKWVDEWLKRWKNEYSIIIIDAPPALIAADVSILAKKVDGVLLICSFLKTELPMLEETIKMLNNGEKKIIGCVLNFYQPLKKYRNYYYYHYKYQKKE
ncbi:MAG: polysaccharide biosynthesis tyrosine autokinase [candidate division WOR-3 bacterium]|nr:polysaccharide biosynthesis tyrosine autokinase [candidate division WOR-3 bacterium]